MNSKTFLLVLAVACAVGTVHSYPKGGIIQQRPLDDPDNPTEDPTEKPTEAPTEKPTEAPTEKPTEAPTEKPTEKPTEAPTEKPTEAPTEKPTEKPTEAPTEKPTEKPTEAPTEKPTEKPTEAPTEKPTEAPTEKPTEKPTEAPTEKPTEKPTEAPTEKPTEKPTEAPTEKPTEAPTEKPTEKPTEAPTEKPTEKPTEAPTEKPTEAPTEKPTTKSPDTPDTTISKDGEPCILATIALSLNVKYDKNDNSTGNATVEVPMDKDITGACTGGKITVDNKTYDGPVLISSWSWDATKTTRETTQNRVIIQFKDDTKSTTLESIAATVSLKNEKIFVNATNPDTTQELNATIGFSTDKNTRFSCTKVTTFEGGEGGDIVLNHVQVEVGNNTSGTFSEVGNECNAGSISIAISLLSALLLSVIITMF